MNNLRVLGLRLHDFSASGGSQQQKQQQSCPADICPLPSYFDNEENDYVVLGVGGDLARFSRRRAPGTASSESDDRQSMQWIVQLNDVLAADSEDECDGTTASDSRSQRWFQLSAAAESSGGAGGTVVVALSREGAIASIDARTGKAELVGEFENGIFAGAWSPDGEILVLVTAVRDDDDDDDDEGGGGGGGGASTNLSRRRFVVLCMNAQWDVLAETDLEEACVLANDNGSSSHRDAASEILICWRPDATLFAVSSVDASDRQRKIRIYQRETLALSALGRNEDGSGTLAPNLLPPLSWAGSGCSMLLSTIQTKGRRQLVAFLEPNGLRHGQFVLPTGTEEGVSATTTVLQLDWNVESDLLSVWLRDGSNADRVQLWHRRNYHWYLKQELSLPGEVRVVRFHPERPYTLIVVAADFSCREYVVQWDPSTAERDALRGGGDPSAHVREVGRVGEARVAPCAPPNDDRFARGRRRALGRKHVVGGSTRKRREN
jgi:IKI3 family